SGKLIDALLAGIDLLNGIAQVSDEGFAAWEARQRKEIDAFLLSLTSLAAAVEPVETPCAEEPPPVAPVLTPVAALDVCDATVQHVMETPESSDKPSLDRTLRVTAENLNRLMGLAGEAMVASRWLDTFSTDLLRVKHVQRQLSRTIESLREVLPASSLG